MQNLMFYLHRVLICQDKVAERHRIGKENNTNNNNNNNNINNISCWNEYYYKVSAGVSAQKFGGMWTHSNSMFVIHAPCRPV